MDRKKLTKTVQTLNKKIVKNVVKEIGITNTMHTPIGKPQKPTRAPRKTRVEPANIKSRGSRKTSAESPAYLSVLHRASALDQDQLGKLLDKLQTLFKDRDEDEFDSMLTDY